MGAKRHVPGRSQPYDTLLFEWQKATNPAFVARLEEKERQIAALKASSQAHKERKRRTTDKRDAERSTADTPTDALDLYQRHATFQDVDRDLSRTLDTIHAAVTRDRTPIMPMATRSLAVYDAHEAMPRPPPVSRTGPRWYRSCARAPQ